MSQQRPLEMPTPEQALPGREQPIDSPNEHFVHGRPLKGPWPDGMEVVYLGLGCFWGAERLYYKLDGVYTTAVGYQGGLTPNPTYKEVCTGMTGHAETVQVVYDPKVISTKQIMTTFWESHDPTQGMRQGNDIGTQYRSVVYYTTAEQKEIAESTFAEFNRLISAEGYPAITTEIAQAVPFYFAEEEHQQYLAKNPQGYCGIGGLGVCFPPEA